MVFFYWSAIILGMVSNLHCLGMCGPLSMALPIHNYPINTKLRKIALYNAGRIASYSLLGVLFGLFGQSLSLFGAQQKITFIIGVLMILVVLFPKFISYNHVFKNYTEGWFLFIKKGFKQALNKRKSLFLFGVLNGLLPCAMIYVALIASISVSSWYQSTLYMIFFGIGTLPVMIIVPLTTRLLTKIKFVSPSKIMSITLLFFGLLFMVRGANLNIPYLSPAIVTDSGNETLKCH